jgi:dTDP-4-dehydrorhamnose 3,5-epimerase
VLDVAVDLRSHSSHFGKWFACELSDANKKILWIPPGFAHGFLSLVDNTILVYKCTQVYNPESERSIRWNDPDLNINWGIENPVVSERDNKAPLFQHLNNPF